MTVNKWMDANMKALFGRKVRLIDYYTREGITDKLFFYMDAPVQDAKITSRFVFIFV